MHNLFKDIAPAEALGIRVHSFEDGHVVLTAPFAPNRNDKGTAFAGSIASMLSLAGWAAITLSLQERDVNADVMIVKSDIDYMAAANAGLFAEATVPQKEIDRVVRELEENGRSRMAVSAHLHSADTPCSTMAASYAIRHKSI